MKTKVITLSIALMCIFVCMFALYACDTNVTENLEEENANQEQPSGEEKPTEHKHSFTNYVSNGNATCIADGTKTAKCDWCDEINTITDSGTKTVHIYGIDEKCIYCTEGIVFTSGLEFEEINNGDEYSLYGIGTATDPEIYIPKEYNGKPVTKISDFAFERNSNITLVWMPDSILEIGSKAFYQCSLLSNVTIGKNVNKIGLKVFSGCNNLNTICINDIDKWCGFSFEDKVFENDWQLFFDGEEVTTLSFSQDSEKIGAFAFYGCTGIINLEISSNITTIDSYAFFGCKNIKNIKFAENCKLVNIDRLSFAKCESLVNISVPDSVKNIEAYAFADCLNLESFVLPKLYVDLAINAQLPDYRIVGVPPMSLLSSVFSGCPKLTKTERGVTYIGDYLLSCDEILTSLKIKDGTIGICAMSCYYRDNLREVHIPKSITNIGAQSFSFCGMIESIRYDGTVKEWNNISKRFDWDVSTVGYTIYCTDGTISKDGTITPKFIK